VKAFQSKKNGIHILVATNVASEGLNLHMCCHRLIHFDLPWSLITLEQRNGRIDRLGQLKTPEIFYFASTAEGARKTPTGGTFKDDFWIIDKIKKRIDTAADDMAEEAMAKFTEASEEELRNTTQYEEGKVGAEPDMDSFLAMLSNPEFAKEASHTKSLNKRPLPTLFEKSPSDFVVSLAKEAKLEVAGVENERVAIKMNNTLRFEVQQWPLEYRPDSENDEVVLDASSHRMQQEYQRARTSSEEVRQSFMNEIHPLISLLENTAMSFFPGRKVPTVTLKGDDKNAVYLLVQSSLFNSRNDVVDQFWQVLYHKKGSPELKALFEMSDYDHAIKITQWLNQNLGNIKQKQELTPAEKRRITDLTSKGIDVMRELTLGCRSQRAQKLKSVLKSELDRIKAWEAGRKDYLESVKAAEEKNREAGIFSLSSRRVQDELAAINKDSDAYRKFIESYLATSAEPDIRILGCLVVEE
jgi:hypothetical protein